MISIFGQFSGNGLGYFNATIFEQIGIKQVSQQLAYNLLNSVLSAIGALSAVTLSDKMRRRPVLIYGTMGRSPPLLKHLKSACMYYYLLLITRSVRCCSGYQFRPLCGTGPPGRQYPRLLCQGCPSLVLLIQRCLLFHLYSPPGRHPLRGTRDNHARQGPSCVGCHGQPRRFHQPVCRPHRSSQYQL